MASPGSMPTPSSLSSSVAAAAKKSAAATNTTITTTSTDAVLRNTLRYTISAHEYAVLHKYIISRSRGLRRAAPTPGSVDKALAGPGRKSGGGRGDDFNARTVRHALRVFIATVAGVKGWEAVSRRIAAKSKHGGAGEKQKAPAVRLAASLSSMLLLYRLLFRFLSRLRAHLVDDQVEPFRRRNPRTAAALTSPYAPALGASLAGLALGVYPSRQQLRVTIAIYAAFRALEFSWNACEGRGLIWGRTGGRRPWWFGSWMLQPLAFGQLLHAVVFDRDCFPRAYGDFIFGRSGGYLHARPRGYSGRTPWPSTTAVVDGLAEMARLGWPAYVSPTMFPSKRDDEVLPVTLRAVSPLTSQAHPLITSLSCATLHPSDPSCSRTLVTFWLSSFPPMARFFLVLYTALTVAPRLGAFYNRPVTTARRLLARALSMSVFAVGAISTAWASICLFQAWLPRRVLATQRFFLGGFLAGLWAWVERRRGRAVFLYSARASVDSLAKVGVKRRWWSALPGVDVAVFIVSLMAAGVVYELEPRAVREPQWRKGLSWIRGEGWRDWTLDDDDDDDDKGTDDENDQDGANLENAVDE